MVNVFKIIFDSHCHLFGGVRLATPTIYLRQPRYARLDLVTQHIAMYQLAILLVMRHCVRTGTYDRHAPLQHIDELRQFVQGSSSQKSAQPCYTRIILLRLRNMSAIFLNTETSTPRSLARSSHNAFA